MIIGPGQQSNFIFLLVEILSKHNSMGAVDRVSLEKDQWGIKEEDFQNSIPILYEIE